MDARSGILAAMSRRLLALDARALEELGPETIDRLAELVEARLVQRRAAGEEVLLTAAAAAEIVGVHAETVRRAIRSGAIEVAGYVGRSARVRRAAVDAWVADGRRLDPVVRASRVAAVRGRGTHARVLRDALGVERAA